MKIGSVTVENNMKVSKKIEKRMTMQSTDERLDIF